ncbi:MAG: hypothetical protein V1774_05645, partial [Candidatus Eisenbacteria bacterium]
RAYWMLPVLLLFYILAVHTVSRIGPRMARGAVLGALALAFAALSYGEIHQARTVRLDELRQWIRTNIPEDSSFYIVGFSVVRLPQNTDCMSTQRTAYERVMEEDRDAGLPFTERHLKYWEETSRLRLHDMLGRQSSGYYFFCYHDLPFDRFPEAALESFEYILVQEGFERAADPHLREILARGYAKVAEARSEGMQGRGLLHEIYKRR